MAQGAGKRAGSRKAPKKTVRVDPSLLTLAGGVTFCVIAWGYLVMAAIDFGGSAREGSSRGWLFLLVACLGAACCLFVGLMLCAKLVAALGLTGTSDITAHEPPDRPEPSTPPTPPRVPGGRRAAR